MAEPDAAGERRDRFRRLLLSSVLLLAPVLVTTNTDARETTAKVEAFWQMCVQQSNVDPATDFYRVRYFGADATTARRLMDLIAAGEKTVTFTLPWIYQGHPNLTPVPGGYTVVTDFEGHPELLLRTTRVKTLAFAEVTEEETRFEGPGARTLDAWRKIHWPFFENALKPLGKQPAEDMPVTVEDFEVVCGLSGTRTATRHDESGAAD